ncbi:MAG: peptide MFS transporter [Chitinophagaceae bacterium]
MSIEIQKRIYQITFLGKHFHLPHPKGLLVLFSTEMWERFNFYGMRALLSLFLVNAIHFSDSQASLIYGAYLGLSYLTPLLGGYLSDNVWGNRKAIIIGALTMACGQMLLFLCGIFYDTHFDFTKILLWIALGILILGNGFFKPNISSMVGDLYPKNDSKIDSAFTIFYMGINLGALMGMAICPWLGDVHYPDGNRNIHAFKWGFLAAAIAMWVGTAIFWHLKNKYIIDNEGKPVGAKPNIKKSIDTDSQKVKFSKTAIGVTISSFLVLFVVFCCSFEKLSVSSYIYSGIYASSIALAGLILFGDKNITKVEKERIIVIYIVSFFVIFFWACFEQAGISLTFIADYQTDRNFLGIDIPPSAVQNANSFFVIALSLPFTWMWTFLNKKKLEPISPAKQAIGLLLLALGYLIIALQVKSLGQGIKIGVIWLFVLYLFQTMGELCLSPIGMSLVSKMAPKRFSSLLMGMWFVSSAAGYALAGLLSTLLPPTTDKFNEAQKLGINLQAVLDKTTILTSSEQQLLINKNIIFEYPTILGFQIENLYHFFMIFVILSGVSGLILFTLLPKLKKMMAGKL